VGPEEATRFGVCEIDEDYRIIGFEEKPTHRHPARSVFDPDRCSISMGIYIFDTKVLLAALRADAEDPASHHDFGRDIIPRILGSCRVVAYNFRDLNDKPNPYWRDVGTLDAYYEANMDLVDVVPQFNLYDDNWPLRTAMPQAAPAKFVFAQEGRRMGVALDSIVSPGVIVSGGRVVRSVLSPGVRVNSYCEIDSSILMRNVKVGRYCRVRRAIIDTDVVLAENTSIGYDLDADREAGHTITEGGVVVVTK
jgi:glucose-1-phosphate adenylyltransferase